MVRQSASRDVWRFVAVLGQTADLSSQLGGMLPRADLLQDAVRFFPAQAASVNSHLQAGSSMTGPNGGEYPLGLTGRLGRTKPVGLVGREASRRDQLVEPARQPPLARSGRPVVLWCCH